MKAIITKIEKGNMQLDIEVTYSNNNGFEEKRVLVISDERVDNMTPESIEEFVKTEGKRYERLFKKRDDFQSLIGNEIRI